MSKNIIIVDAYNLYHIHFCCKYDFINSVFPLSYKNKLNFTSCSRIQTIKMLESPVRPCGWVAFTFLFVDYLDHSLRGGVTNALDQTKKCTFKKKARQHIMCDPLDL